MILCDDFFHICYRGRLKSPALSKSIFRFCEILNRGVRVCFDVWPNNLIAWIFSWVLIRCILTEVIQLEVDVTLSNYKPYLVKYKHFVLFYYAYMSAGICIIHTFMHLYKCMHVCEKVG